MLKRRAKDKGRDSREPFTFIHEMTTITGELRAKGRVRVHGAIHGHVEVAGVLEVAEGGVIVADVVRADEVKIIGSVTANIEAQGKVEIWSQGRLEGDVRASALDIEEGASFIGRSDMRGSGASEQQPPSLAPPVPAEKPER